MYQQPGFIATSLVCGDMVYHKSKAPASKANIACRFVDCVCICSSVAKPVVKFKTI